MDGERKCQSGDGGKMARLNPRRSAAFCARLIDRVRILLVLTDSAFFKD